MKLRVFLFLAATLAAVLSSGALAAEKVFDVIGVIRAPLDARGGITIAHDDIAGFMPAMTMSFSAAVPAEAVALKAGDRVRFRLHVGDDSSRATDFIVIGKEASRAPVSPEKITRKRIHEGDLVSDFSLITESRNPLTPEELRGHLTIVTFIFTRCPVPEYCPAMAQKFARLQKAILADHTLAERCRLLSITLDPEFDRPDVLKSYGEAIGANPLVWQFATGSKEQIDALTKSFAVFTERNGVTLDHTLCTALIDATGHVTDIWRGNAWQVDEVLAAIAATNHE